MAIVGTAGTTDFGSIDPLAEIAPLGRQAGVFENGLAFIGQTIVRGRQCLKLTGRNPIVSKEHIENLLRLIVKQGKQMEQDYFRS